MYKYEYACMYVTCTCGNMHAPSLSHLCPLSDSLQGYAFAAAFNRITVMTANYCGEGRAPRERDRYCFGGYGRSGGGDTSTLRANYRDGLVTGLDKAVKEEKAERKRQAKEREERKRCVCACVCVCLYARARECERGREEGGREGGRAICRADACNHVGTVCCISVHSSCMHRSVCVCWCVCVCVYLCVCVCTHTLYVCLCMYTHTIDIYVQCICISHMYSEYLHM